MHEPLNPRLQDIAKLSPPESPQRWALVSEADCEVRHMVNNAKRIIIHVEMIHGASAGNPDAYSSFVRSFRNATMATAYKYVSQYKLRTIYSDSMTKEDAPSFNETIAFFRRAILDKEYAAALVRRSPKLASELEVFMRQYSLAPPLRAVCDFNLQIGGLEEGQLLAQGAKLFEANRGRITPELAANIQEREAAIVKNAAKLSDKVILIMLGQGHDLVKHVRQSNELNPLNQSSLIEARLVGTPIDKNAFEEWYYSLQGSSPRV